MGCFAGVAQRGRNSHLARGGIGRMAAQSRRGQIAGNPVPSMTPLHFHGKEGVDGSSPSEGLGVIACSRWGFGVASEMTDPPGRA